MDKEEYKLIAIAFAEFLENECIQSFKGYILTNNVTPYDSTEFQLDELYDYWFDNIFKPLRQA